MLFVLSAIVAPFYAYREQKLNAAKDSLAISKVKADNQLANQRQLLGKVLDSVNTLRRTITTLKGGILNAKENYAAIATRLNTIRQDSIQKNERQVFLHNAVETYKRCLFDAFQSYIVYLRADQNQASSATELVIEM